MQDDIQLKKDLFWNTAGSLVYAASSMILAFIVMRVQGPDDGGVFAFGFSTLGHQLFIISYFGLRGIYITDVRQRFSFAVYRRFRIMTVAASAVFSVFYMTTLYALGIYSAYKAVTILFLIAWKLADGIADLYECECQRSMRLWIAGRELAVRTVISVAVFTLVLLMTGSLAVAAALGAAAQYAVYMIFRKYCMDSVFPEAGVSVVNIAGSVKKLVSESYPLFLSVFLDYYVISSPKYAIDTYLTDADSGIFNIIFMPTNIIYVLANFFMKPFMTRLSVSYATGDMKNFRRVRDGIVKLIAGLTVFAVLAVILAGGPVLRLVEIILGPGCAGMLTPYKYELAAIMAGGGIYALSSLYYYLIIIRGKQKNIMYIYFVLGVFALATSGLAVRRFGMTGGAWVYLIYTAVMGAGFYLASGRDRGQ